MTRTVHHHAYVARPYAVLCDELERVGAAHIDAATLAATTFAADLVGYLEDRLGFFDADERVNAVVGTLERTDHGATMPIEWQADARKRLLPSVHATLALNPIISTGPGATSELVLDGVINLPHERHRSLVEQLLTRRVTDATLHTFVRHLAAELAGPLKTSR